MALDMKYFEEMEAKIPKGKVRTRFAPSPTGYMHVGNLRTALYTWLIARHNQGTFILRIEDTDQTRQVEGATEVIYRTLAECGLDHDEGPDVGGPVAPYIQTERRDTYGKYARLLVEKGHAYYCFCEKTESEEDAGEFDRPDDPCRTLDPQEAQARVDAGEPYVIRQKIPHEGTTTFHDAIFGDITVEGGGPPLGDPLADDVGLPGVHPGLGLGGIQVPAGVGGPVELAALLLALRLLAEAVVGVAPLHQQPGILTVGVPALRLDIGGHGAAHVRALVVGQAALRHGAVDDVDGALHQAALVGVFDAQDEVAAAAAGDEPGV